jgi:hypothetical protein
VSNFQWVWRYSCLSVTHKKPSKSMKERQITCWLHLLVMYMISINCNRSKQVLKNPNIEFNMNFSALLAIVRVALLRSAWCSCCMRAALFIMRATNSSLVFIFLCRLRFSSIPTDKNRICTRQIQTAVSLHTLKIWHMFIWSYLRGTVHITTS